MDVRPGEIHALIGENGAGKSTLMNILFGMPVIHDTGGFEGTVEIDGEDAHIMTPHDAMEKGIGKLVLNEAKLKEDLDTNWAVVAEAIQTILRRENYPQPYEALKELTRGKSRIDKQSIHRFIGRLKIPASLKKELKKITPHSYTGI